MDSSPCPVIASRISQRFAVSTKDIKGDAGTSVTAHHACDAAHVPSTGKPLAGNLSIPREATWPLSLGRSGTIFGHRWVRCGKKNRT
jgi:hypothetical protein